MMAAVEARAAWQRIANRYFVQEDAKRAPKLASCPSSSSSSKLQVDAGNGSSPNALNHPAAGVMPLDWNLSNYNISPHTKWWLKLQTNFGYQKEFTFEQLNALEAELEVLRAEEAKETSKLKLDEKAKTQGLKILNSNNTEFSVKHNHMEYWYNDEDRIDLDCVDRLISAQYDKCNLGLAVPCVGVEKTEPWWRITDKDELASLVAQRSLEHIENCDLPPIQTSNIRRGLFTSPGSPDNFCEDGICSSPLDQKPRVGLFNRTAYARDSPICGNIHGNQWASDEKENFLYDPEEPIRTTNSHPTEARTLNNTDSEPSNAQLLEALRHSQTRAREAEDAVKKAYCEKELVIELIFQQASNLFAYKQWMQLLQCETICHKNQPNTTPFPYKSQRAKKSKHKNGKAKKKKPIYDITKNAVAFAVGLSLVGAGLLLGWTIGWLLPRF